MADDPTATGQDFQITVGGEQIAPENYTSVLRSLPGAHVREHFEFELPIKGDLLFTVLNNELTISLEVSGPDGSDPHRVSLPPRPLYEFGSPEELNTYLAAVRQNFFKLLRPRLHQEVAFTLQTVCLGLYFMLNPGAGDQETIIEGYTGEVARQLRQLLAGLPEKQKPGGWSKIALRNAVVTAGLRLALRGLTGRALTLDAVREEMRAEFKDYTPASGEALRQQLRERGLNWRAIKREVENLVAEVKARRAAAQNPENETGG